MLGDFSISFIELIHSFQQVIWVVSVKIPSSVTYFTISQSRSQGLSSNRQSLAFVSVVVRVYYASGNLGLLKKAQQYRGRVFLV